MNSNPCDRIETANANATAVPDDDLQLDVRAKLIAMAESLSQSYRTWLHRRQRLAEQIAALDGKLESLRHVAKSELPALAPLIERADHDLR